MLLYVDLPEGGRITVEVLESDTVANLKETIAFKGGPAAKDVDLFHNRQSLTDSRTITQCGLRPETRLAARGKSTAAAQEGAPLLSGGGGSGSGRKCCTIL
ncbi:uncharacterized protein LOC135820968 [Sycon ciliatum]|uniref:uncharacterized protein LOC135820968 n=1 Tax=Sycon ciliatum TaxID=27933 RepID=UPI0020A971F6|eukprot:scpid78233/ scgid17361/ 